MTSHCPLLSLTCHHQDHLVPSSCLAVTSHSCTESCLPLLPSTYTIVSSSMHIHGCQTASVSPWKRLCHPVHGGCWGPVRSLSVSQALLGSIVALSWKWLCVPPESCCPPQPTKRCRVWTQPQCCVSPLQCCPGVTRSPSTVNPISSSLLLPPTPVMTPHCLAFPVVVPFEECHN